VKVVELLKPEPDQAIIAMLEDLLSKAKQGDVTAIAVAAQVRIDGDSGTLVGYDLGQNGDIAHLVCAIERTKLALLRAGNED